MMQIRPETDADHPAIFALTAEAFAPMSFSDGTEAAIIGQLRAAGDLTLSLVAVEGDVIIGHAAFSPLSVGDATGWYSLGPIAVAVDRQKQGIGSALAGLGCDTLCGQGANGVALIGNPEVYGPMGFQSKGLLSYRDLPRRLVQHQIFAGEEPAGEILFAPALEA